MAATDNNVAKLQTPFDIALERMCFDMTTAQLRQHVELYQATLGTISGYIDSPRAAGIHRDVLRFWRFQVATFTRLERGFSQALAARAEPQPSPPPDARASASDAAKLAAAFAADPSLRRVRKIVETAGAPEIFRLRADLIAQLRGVSQIPLAPEIHAVRLRELHFVVFAIEYPELVRKGTDPCP